jgi:hypothetical protein
MNPTLHKGIRDSVESHVGVAVERGIVERAEGGDAVLAAGHLAVEHVEKSGKKNNDGAGAEVADGKVCRGAEIDEEAQKGQEIGIDAGGGYTADNPVEKPLPAGSNCTCKRRHDLGQKA